jgi:hypothetical protein
VPLGFYFLAVLFILLSASGTLPSVKKKLFLIAGLFAGSAAWTKNEGILFLLVTSFVFFATLLKPQIFRQRKSELFYFSLGVLPFLLVLLYFKISLAPTNDIMQGQGSGTLGRLLEIERWQLTLKAFFNEMLHLGNGLMLILFLYLILLGVQKNKAGLYSLIRPALVLFIVLSGYFLTYIIMQYQDIAGLKRHLNDMSIKRLYLQLLPAALLLYFCVVKIPGDLINNVNISDTSGSLGGE